MGISSGVATLGRKNFARFAARKRRERDKADRQPDGRPAQYNRSASQMRWSLRHAVDRISPGESRIPRRRPNGQETTA
jgi:hypothetical protein